MPMRPHHRTPGMESSDAVKWWPSAEPSVHADPMAVTRWGTKALVTKMGCSEGHQAQQAQAEPPGAAGARAGGGRSSVGNGEARAVGAVTAHPPLSPGCHQPPLAQRAGDSPAVKARSAPGGRLGGRQLGSPKACLRGGGGPREGQLMRKMPFQTFPG